MWTRSCSRQAATASVFRFVKVLGAIDLSALGSTTNALSRSDRIVGVNVNPCSSQRAAASSAWITTSAVNSACRSRWVTSAAAHALS